MPNGPAARHCPFDFADALEFDPALRELMAEGPVTRIRLPYGQDEAWLVTGYDDVRTVTTDRRFSRHAIVGRDFPRMTPEPIVQDEAINLMDPPASNRLRALVSKAFARDLLEHARTRTRLATDALLDAMAAQGPGADLVEHLAGPLPLTVICEVLDIPEGDRATLRGHARTMMDTTPEGRAAAVRAKADMRAYFATLTAQRRRAPGPDLISALATARDGDQTLDPDELTVMAMVLLITGQDTTTYQIANLAYALLTRPDQLALLRARPDQLAPVVNELLRLIPFRKGVGIPRIATEDVQLGGVTINAGDTVHVSYLTANRDPDTFHRPDELDLERPGPAHMTFGWGAHHCLGAPLASIELHTALDALLSRFPRLALARPAQEIRWNTTSIWRHPLELPVTW
ncbi:cytochrome P450 [Streptacidiphilus sp. P02-A3a]|uniref:cytochrome P450 n=1 Tax=Streptacidiphilus sp. P02-A3a TaxID=2704468 RepID=UPI0015FB6219|nr:cytochrome P450 [Streptacidiphilus sp. P02-A3a]QMU69966.1 cytochrome P450 [Streptacidiphilus sp. P02-A3a]